jgi:hypothetical protein
VLRTDQVPGLVQALSRVSATIEGMWAHEGDRYAEDHVLRSPDPQDPEVIKQRHVEHLKFMQLIADNLTEVIPMLTQAASTDEALLNLAAFLGVDEAEVMIRLARFDMLALTRAAYDRRLQMLDGREA